MYKSVMLTVVAAVALQGCVIAVHDGDSSTGKSRTEWRAQQELNQSFIHSLDMGVSIAEVQRRLGDPDFTEAFGADDGEYRVLFYRTHHVRSDGKTTREETTPIVCLDGAVVGFGEDYYRRLTGL
jgi:hypothetical protein